MITAKQILEKKGNKVFTANPDTQVMDALRMMVDNKVGSLIIIENDQVVGVFTEQDFIRRVLLEDLDSSLTTVESAMSKNPITIEPKKTVNESLQIMTDKRIRHLPVIDENKLVGLVSIGDCVKEVIAEQEQIIDHLEHYIQS